MSFNFSKFVDDVLANMSMSDDEVAFLRALSNSAGRYPDFVKILDENPAVEGNLIDAANRTYGPRVEEIITSTEVALGMMGFIPARNYLVASIINKNQRMNPWDDSIKLTLRYALEGEMYGGTLAQRYFAAGLAYDFVLNSLVTPDKEGNLPPIPKFVSDTWRHSLQVCSIARQLVNRLFTTLQIEKDICLHAILHDIGKIAFYLMDDSYKSKRLQDQIKMAAGKLERAIALGVPISDVEVKSADAAPGVKEGVEKPEGEEEEEEVIDRSLICFPERAWADESEKYGLSHDMIGHLILWTLGFLPDSHWIVLYHHQPFLAARRGQTAHLHTTLIWLADQICRYREFHTMSRFGDRVTTGWYNVLKPFLGTTNEAAFRTVVNSLVFS